MPIIVLLMGLFLFSSAQAIELQEGRDYTLIEPAPPPGVGDEVEVLEFFMFTCPHCKNLNPAVQAWQKKLPANIKFQHVPAMFGGVANVHGKLFYALQVMGEEKRLHDLIFQAIHDQKKRLRKQSEIDAFLRENGVDLDKFHAALKSFTVQTKANRAAALARRYKIQGVPTFVIDGRYKVKNSHQVLEVVDALIAKVLAERK